MATLPASITITQDIVVPSVEVVRGAIQAPGQGVPPYPLATDPSELWWLTYQGGALVWVQQPQPPDLSALDLEDGEGVFLLEDNLGVILQEPS